VRALLRQDPSLANRLGGYEGYYLGAGAPLANAAAAGRLDIVQQLLDHGADPNLPEEQIAPRGKALYLAVFNGHYEIAKLLLERGAFPNPPVESSGDALWVASERRPDARMEQLFLSYGATPTREDADEACPAVAHNWLRITPLREAARAGDLERANALLDAGADLTARDEHLRSTPLAWAAKFGQREMVTLLLERGAPAQSAGRSGVGDVARLGEEARARGDRPPVAAIEQGREDLQATVPVREAKPRRAFWHGQRPLSWSAHSKLRGGPLG
jgi:ankyrin repeat protein